MADETLKKLPELRAFVERLKNAAAERAAASTAAGKGQADNSLHIAVGMLESKVCSMIEEAVAKALENAE